MSNNYYNKNNSENVTTMINVPLSKYYENKEEVFLPNGIAYNYAVNFKFIKSNQLRKILSFSKKCVTDDKEQFMVLRNKLFSLVWLSAYNAGRDRSNKPLYDFIKANINKDSIKSIDDINMFDELFTAIVAYHKSI